MTIFLACPDYGAMLGTQNPVLSAVKLYETSFWHMSSYLFRSTVQTYSFFSGSWVKEDAISCVRSSHLLQMDIMTCMLPDNFWRPDKRMTFWPLVSLNHLSRIISTNRHDLQTSGLPQAQELNTLWIQSLHLQMESTGSNSSGSNWRWWSGQGVGWDFQDDKCQGGIFGRDFRQFGGWGSRPYRIETIQDVFCIGFHLLDLIL